MKPFAKLALLVIPFSFCLAVGCGDTKTSTSAVPTKAFSSEKLSTQKGVATDEIDFPKK